MINYLKNRRAKRDMANAYYEAAQAQARQAVFYETYCVPDTPYGRFDMIVLHCYLLVRRLNEAGEPKVAQKVFDKMFKTLDLAMREMGIGDLSVPKKMKKFMKDFNGRATRYESALKSDDKQELIDAVRRNIYGTADDVSDANLEKMADYIKTNSDLSIEGPDFVSLQEKKAA